MKKPYSELKNLTTMLKQNVKINLRNRKVEIDGNQLNSREDRQVSF